MIETLLFLAGFSFLLVGVAGYLRADADSSVTVTRALPATDETLASAGIDLGHGTKGSLLVNAELLLNAPALTTTELPNADTHIYDLFHDDAANFGSEVLLADNVLTQTGAGGTGAAAAEKRFRLPSDVKRYVRMKVTGAGGVGNASAKSATLQLKF